MQADEYQRLAGRTSIEQPGFELGDKETMISWNALGLAGEAGEVAPIEVAVRCGQVLRIVFEVEVVNHRQCGHVTAQSQVSVRGKEGVGFELAKTTR